MFALQYPLSSRVFHISNKFMGGRPALWLPSDCKCACVETVLAVGLGCTDAYDRKNGNPVGLRAWLGRFPHKSAVNRIYGEIVQAKHAGQARRPKWASICTCSWPVRIDQSVQDHSCCCFTTPVMSGHVAGACFDSHVGDADAED